MATFPALTPAPYDLTPGQFPVSETAAMNGEASMVRHGNAEIGRTITLQFVGLTEAEFLLLKDHYRGQRSTFDSFLFTTTTLPAADTPAGQSWTYASAPEVEDLHTDFFNVSCSFTCQPRGGVLIGSVQLVSMAGPLVPGAFTDGRTPFGTGAALVSPASTLTPGRMVAGTLWAPTNLPALELYLNFTNTGARHLQGGVYQHQDDESGNNRQASQATTSRRPTPGTSTSGVACMATTAGQFLQLAASITTARFVLVAAEFFQPDTGNQFLIGDAIYSDFFAPYPSDPRPDLLLHPSYSSASVRNGDGWMTGTRTAPVAMVKRNRPTSYEFATTASVSVSEFSADRTNFYGDRGIIGNQYAIVVCSALPSDADRWRLQGWIAHRLLVPGDLPADHPYRSTLPIL